MPQPPALTDEQRRAALAKAAEVRRVRAEVKDALKAGRVTLAAVLSSAESDELVAGIKVLAIIESLPGVGKVTARQVMEQIGIAESRRIRGLGEHQRRALLDRFPA